MGTGEDVDARFPADSIYGLSAGGARIVSNLSQWLLYKFAKDCQKQTYHFKAWQNKKVELEQLLKSTKSLELGYDEIAQILGTTPGNVGVILHRAKEHLPEIPDFANDTEQLPAIDATEVVCSEFGCF
jgi:hypothetical protein